MTMPIYKTPNGYVYKVFVRHPYGTDAVMVTTRKRDIKRAREEAIARVVRFRRTGDVLIVDAVPMVWTEKGMVMSRRMRVTSGKFNQKRRARSRASRSSVKRKVR